MNRHLTLDGASVNSDLCSDHHCNGWTQAIADMRTALENVREYASMIPLHLGVDADPHIQRYVDQIEEWCKEGLRE